MIKYCNLCERNVAPGKKFNWGWFIVLMILCGAGLIYALVYLMKTADTCPICGNKNLLPPDTQAKILAAKAAQQAAAAAPPQTPPPAAE